MRTFQTITTPLSFHFLFLKIKPLPLRWRDLLAEFKCRFSCYYFVLIPVLATMFDFGFFSGVTWAFLALFFTLLLLWVDPFLCYLRRGHDNWPDNCLFHCYRYGVWPYHHFKKLGIRGPRPLPFMGSTFYYRKVRVEPMLQLLSLFLPFKRFDQ